MAKRKSKPNPAKWSDPILDEVAKIVRRYKPKLILDPMAGSGKLHRLYDMGYSGRMILNDLEVWDREDTTRALWCTPTDARLLHLDMRNRADMIITSPTYGNRMADHHNANDGSKRMTYTHALGKKLKEGNTGKTYFWQAEYVELHAAIYENFRNLLSPGGIVVVNVSDFIRNGERQEVVYLHKGLLQKAGFKFVKQIAVETRRLRLGENREKRVATEAILIYKFRQYL